MVLLLTLGLVQVDPPMVTVAPVRNPLPVTVTEVPPESAPAVGEMEVILGAGL